MLVQLKQLNQTDLALFVQQQSSGAALSGALQPYVNASGWLGPHVLYVSGGPQIVLGTKTFETSPIVPYSGGTGAAPSTQWVIDNLISVSGAVTGSFVTSNTFQTIGVPKTFTQPISVGSPTGLSNAITLAFLTGVSGVLASGGGGGGGSSVIVTGSSPISPARFTGAGNVVAIYDGTQIIFSGTAGGGSTPPGLLYTTGNQTILDQKTFTGSPLVPAPTQTSGAVNLGMLTGLSGLLSLAITGATGYNVYNTYFITGTGTTNLSYAATGAINNTFNVTSGTVNNTTNISLSGITGNFVNASFYFDEFNLSTGLYLQEGFVSRTFTMTGFALGVWTSGTQGNITGTAYQRDRNNTKQPLFDFFLNSGVFYTGVGGLNVSISGQNRMGVSIFGIGTGFTGLSVGIFGVGS